MISVFPQIIRLLTALGIIGVCGWPIWEGINIIRYAYAVSEPEVRRWISVPGIASSASQYALTNADETSDENAIIKRRDELGHILTITPLSSFIWLQLAETRIDAHDPLEKALEALELSAITGPNEGYIITQRGLFGIWQWEKLTPEARLRAINDMVAIQISDAKITWLKTTLAEKQEPVRQEIRAALQAGGFSEADLARIGLK
jgi:hypothetical protein